MHPYPPKHSHVFPLSPPSLPHPLTFNIVLLYHVQHVVCTKDRAYTPFFLGPSRLSCTNLQQRKGLLMPSYSYRRGLAPRARKETLEEVKARIRIEIQERTEARVRYWISLAEWCYCKPGRYIRVNWGSRITTSTSSEGSSCVEIPD